MRSNPNEAMRGQLCVLQTEVAPPADVEPGAVHVQPGASPEAGFPALEQSVLALGPGSTLARKTGEAEEVLFVAAGAGWLRVGDEQHALEAESGAYLAPREEYEVAAGQTGMRVVRVRIPEPVMPEPAGDRTRTVVSRLGDQSEQDATTDRWFRIVSDPSTGLRSATHFVGYIPTVRAPEHFHTYDEVIHVLEGEGRLHAEGTARPVAPGTCIGLPARLVHCLENTGADVMRVVAVFRPAGSPAAAYYPDGTPAFEGGEPAAADLK